MGGSVESGVSWRVEGEYDCIAMEVLKEVDEICRASLIFCTIAWISRMERPCTIAQSEFIA